MKREVDASDEPEEHSGVTLRSKDLVGPRRSKGASELWAELPGNKIRIEEILKEMKAESGAKGWWAVARAKAFAREPEHVRQKWATKATEPPSQEEITAIVEE